MPELLQQLHQLEGAFPELAARIFEDAPDAIVIVDRDMNIWRVNRQCELLFGYHRSELISGSIHRLVPEDIRGRHAEHVSRFMGEPYTRPMGVGMDLRGLHKDGHQIPVEINLSPTVTRHGSFVIAFIRKKRQADAK